jgi:hypothetical protein
MDKSQFTSSLEFERAVAIEQYAGEEQIDPKIAGMCLKDTVGQSGPSTSYSIGSCELSDTCTFRNDKYSGVAGQCLKAIVGLKTTDDLQ